MTIPPIDPAPVTRHLRAMFGSQLLIAAVHHLRVVDQLLDGPLAQDALSQRLRLSERPMMVLIPALCAMNLLQRDADGNLSVTELGRYVAHDSHPTLAGYVGLEKDHPGVLEMVDRLRNDGPLTAPQGVSFVKEGGEPSPMDDPDLSRFFTLGLAGRAQLLAPVVAEHLPTSAGHLLDVAGGTGYYTYEWLRRNPAATATLFDRPAVLAVAAELLADFAQSDRPGAESVPHRARLLAGDMLTDPLPQTDMLLAGSLFHDWPADTCQRLMHRFAASLRTGGELWVHDAFLDDTLDGPLAVTDYSAQLFWNTRGRCYSRAEHRRWFAEAGLHPGPDAWPTRLDYGLIWARKL